MSDEGVEAQLRELAQCPDPIECKHEAALGETEEQLHWARVERDEARAELVQLGKELENERRLVAAYAERGVPAPGADGLLTAVRRVLESYREVYGVAGPPLYLFDEAITKWAGRSGPRCDAKHSEAPGHRSCTLVLGHGGRWHDDGAACWLVNPPAPDPSEGRAEDESNTTMLGPEHDECVLANNLLRGLLVQRILERDVANAKAAEYCRLYQSTADELAKALAEVARLEAQFEAYDEGATTGPQSESRTWTAEMPAEPPIHTRVQDRDGDLWIRVGDGYWNPVDHSHDAQLWESLVSYLGPLTEVLEAGDSRG